jgi:hypothetical protein
VLREVEVYAIACGNANRGRECDVSWSVMELNLARIHERNRKLHITTTGDACRVPANRDSICDGRVDEHVIVRAERRQIVPQRCDPLVRHKLSRRVRAI